MRVLLQRVSRATVRVDGAPVATIAHGLLAFVGVSQHDGEQDAERLARKVARLRVFEDDAGKMNLALGDVHGAALVVSQFTLYADARKGNRPSFVGAAPPDRADALYRSFATALAGEGVPVETGVFQAMMEVELVNDGPVTIWLDSSDL